MFDLILALFAFPLLALADDPVYVTKPECAKDGDEVSDAFYHYECKNGVAQFMACVGENGTSIGVNETGLYQSGEYTDIFINCTVVLAEDGGWEVDPVRLDVVKKEGCIFNGMFYSVGYILESGEFRHFCKKFENGTMSMQRYPIHDCLYKGINYKANEQFTADRQFVFTCESTKNSSQANFQHCLTPKNAELQLGEKNEEDGKLYTCVSKTKLEAKEIVDKEVTSEPTKEEASEQKKEETSEQKKEETSEQKKEETSEPKKEEASEQKKEETSEQKKEETSEQKKEETSEQKKEETSEQKKEETSEQKKEETFEQKKEDTSEQKKEVASEPKKEEASEPKKEETSEQKKEVASEPKKGETFEPKKGETFEPKPNKKNKEKKEEKA